MQANQIVDHVAGELTRPRFCQQARSAERRSYQVSSLN
jgi:hypothetical protein